MIGKTKAALGYKKTMEINVLFFGVLADYAGVRRKHYTGIESYSDLKHRIFDDYPGIEHYTYKIAVNKTIINNDPVLRDGDELAFMPPFAGG
ncbi:MAG TPA: MoaD/ThiS family protein [Bacteroidales bacterium]|nr:MoaD/ThiS family protein [Bacteroidales bacterium]